MGSIIVPIKLHSAVTMINFDYSRTFGIAEINIDTLIPNLELAFSKVSSNSSTINDKKFDKGVM